MLRLSGVQDDDILFRATAAKLMRSLLQSTVIAAVLHFFFVSAARAVADAPSSLGLAQTPIVHSWGTGAGLLPQNTVTAIVQSQDGYLWLGTRDGLARFDGVHFKVFGLEQGLPSVDISSLLEDRQGGLWIGTYGAGLCHLKAGRIEIMANPSRQPGCDTIFCLQTDSTGLLWVGTGGGLRFCRDGKLVEDAAFAELPNKPIRCLLRSRDGTTMWIASSLYGLVAYRNGHLESCLGPAGHERIVAQTLFEDRQGRLWVSIGNGMVLCRENAQWRVFDETNGLPFAYISCLTEDADGTIWAGSLDDGLYRFDGTRFNVMRRREGLSAEDIRSLYCDHAGNLWVGTRTGGLNRLSKRNLLVVAGAQGLTNDFTRSVAETADGALWVGTIGGSLYRGGVTGFHPFRPEPVGSLIYFYASVDSVLATPDGSLWWGAAGALFQWKDNHLASAYTNELWLQSVTIHALQDDRHGGIWLGTSGGQLMHLRDGRFTEFPVQLTRAAITSLAVAPDDSLWVGTVADGVKHIREGSDEITSITSGLASTSIRTIYLDDDGTLWIGTAGGGLGCWRQGRVASFNASRGLAVRTVSQIVEDDHGFLWLGCNSGIYKVSKRNLLDYADGKLSFVHSRSFGNNDGMLAEECSGGFCPAGLKMKSGLICISTVRGLVFLNPNDHQHETPPPKVMLEEALINGQLQPLARSGVDADGQPLSPRLVIAPGNHDIELHYTATDFSAPEKIGFRYKLEGADSDSGWTEAFGRRTAYYQRIPPGNYVFHVQACNADGVWSDQDTTLAIAALPFFWETATFYLATILVLSSFFAATLWWIVRRRYKLRLARLQTLNAIERERLRISKDMHDHVGGVLTQVSQLSDMGLNEVEDKELVKNRLERIGNRARAAVQSLDEIVWATNPKNDNLASFAEYVSRYGDEFFEYTNIRCWQEVPATLPALPLRADVRHNVFLAAREAFNNALKHAKCTEVWLRMKLDEGRMILEIEDNGCGFNPAQTAPGGNGLGNMQARLTEDGGQTVVSSAPGKGTRIRFIFPLTK
jgi:ligand-binding sensor domain-containing protein/signal transduction histidine kinase